VNDESPEHEDHLNDPAVEAVHVVDAADHAMIPAPTGAPIVFAFGTTLSFAGLVTNPWVTVVGMLCTIAGIIGWWRDVLPAESMERIPEEAYRPIDTGPEEGTSPPSGAQHAPARKVLPLEIPRIRSGVIGGLCGAFAMAVVALLWGVLQGSVWLPINLLAAMVLSSYDTESIESLSTFQASGLATGIGIHLAFSIMIGLLLGAMMPMASGWPWLFSCLVVPVIWSLLAYSGMGVLDPTLEKHVDWPWFFVSQFAFAIVAGIVIGRSEKIAVVQYLSPAERFKIDMNKGRTGGSDSGGEGS
jgi:hypothetical protein